MDHPYVTYDNDFIESEWWALKDIYGIRDFSTRALRSFPTAPAAERPLSSHEVAQGYKACKGALCDGTVSSCVGEDAYFLAWTTTPWTLPSNVALCVNPEETYCKVKAADGRVYYLAQALLDTVLGSLARGRKARL